MIEQFYTVEEIIAKLKVSRLTLYRYIKSWKISAYKFWKELRIKSSDFDEFIKTHKFISINDKNDDKQ